MKIFRFAAVCAALALAGGGIAWAQQPADLESRNELRICADPHNLPFSNQQGEGFENKIAELIGKELNLPVKYTYFPDSQGFVRATLMKNLCDAIMGTVAGVENMSTTDPYYHTAYVLVTRTSDHYKADRVSDLTIAGKRFGLIAATPPTDLIVEHNLMDQTSIYQLMVDTRVDQPSHNMLTDLVAGRIDVGLLWGPIAGYYTKHDKLPLNIVFLSPEDSKVRLDYHIAIGVRQSDTAFRRRLNQVISKDQPQITQILRDYGVPMLDEQNKPLFAAP